jgi:hypothetical protein
VLFSFLFIKVFVSSGSSTSLPLFYRTFALPLHSRTVLCISVPTQLANETIVKPGNLFQMAEAFPTMYSILLNAKLLSLIKILPQLLLHKSMLWESMNPQFILYRICLKNNDYV